MIDYHVHLWPHGQRDRPPTVEELAGYCQAAQAQGVEEIALTEHLFRFRQADAVLGGFWEDHDDPRLGPVMARYWADHARADLDVYVATVLEAKAAGLPVVLGLEVDYYQGRMATVADLLAGYPFDVLLGSVHWIGAWLFDYLDDETSLAEWGMRSIEQVWDTYTVAVEELAASGVCDVLAHPDVIKVAGHRPAAPGEFHHRIAEAAASSGMAAEVSSAGWRKPVGEAYPAPDLLAAFHARSVPVTTASDAHRRAEVAARSFDLADLLAGAGYSRLRRFAGRQARDVDLRGSRSSLPPPHPGDTASLNASGTGPEA